MNLTDLIASTETDALTGFRYPLLTAFVALMISMFFTPVASKLAFKYGAVDDPKRDDRRVHREPLPRWGGMAIFGGFALAVLCILPFANPGKPFPPYLIGILVLSFLVVVIGALDDLFSYSAKIQMLFLLGAGVLVQFIYHGKDRVQISGIMWPPFSQHHQWVSFGVWGIVLSAIYIFVVTKTMDTIDGIDGLASGIAAIAGGTLTIIAVVEGQPRVAIVAAALAGGSLGFLRHNYNPSKIIMGTGGAQLLGFVLASLSIVGAMKTAAAFALVIPMFIFGIPLFDAVQVMIRRKLSGVPITQADKRHVHHQLLKRGLSQRQAVWVLYTIALALSAVLVTLVILHGKSS